MRVFFKFTLFVIIAILLLASGCTSSPTLEKGRVSPNFEIYLVDTPKLGDVIDTTLSDIPVQSEPLLTEEDLVIYDWSEHILSLTPEGAKKFPSQIPLDGLPFVVMAKGERIYLGAFWTPISSLYIPELPIIMMPSDSTTIQILYSSTSGQVIDPRNNSKLYTVLKETGKLK